MKDLIKLSRELVENLFNGKQQKLGKEYFFMFSISKFILLKEKILKKNSANNILYFDNIKDGKYIPAILSFADEIKKNGSYQINKTSIRLEKIDKYSKKIAEALWLFNKVRDSLAHGQYTIDLKNDCILINNDHSNDKNNSYKLVCSISIKLLNSISFYIEEIKETKDKKDLSIAYRDYIKRISTNYDIDTEKLFDNKFIIDNKYYNNKFKLDNNEYYDNTYNINNEYLNKNEGIQSKPNQLYTSTEEKDDNIIKTDLNKLKIEELYRLVKLLLDYNPTSEKQKEQITKIIKEFKSLVDESIKLEEQKVFDTKSSELMREISDILGIKVGTKNKDASIALYMYMNLVFGRKNEIDYSHICLRNLIFDINPYKYKDKDLDNPDLTEEEKQKIIKIINFEKNYLNIKNYINKLCIDFSKKMDSRIEIYYTNPSENFRHSLMGIYAEFYTSIINYIGKRNQLIISSLRNSVEHGNYYVNKNGSLILYDQIDHSDNNSIKFLSSILPQQLFDITKTIELCDSKDKYIMDDFFKELEHIVDKTTLNSIMNTMNNYSKIIFGKNIDINNSMEHMYQEALANIISQHIKV